MPPNQVPHAKVGAKKFHPRSARQQDAIELARFHRRQRGVGVQRNPVAAGDVNPLSQAGHGDVRARPSQQVDRGDRLNLLKTFRQKHKNAGHGKVEH